jgi:hypothetical protein
LHFQYHHPYDHYYHHHRPCCYHHPTTSFVELNIGLGKVGSEHSDLMLGGHQVGPGASGLLHLVEHFQGLKDFILGHLPLVVGRASWDELLAKHFIVVDGKLIKE